MRTAKHSKGRLYRTTAALDAATLPQLDQIAPDNISEAIRFCIAYALDRGALTAALVQHTPQQRAAYLERYHQPQPITQLYNGQPIPTAAPAPQPMGSQAAAPAPLSWTPADARQPTAQDLRRYIYAELPDEADLDDATEQRLTLAAVDAWRAAHPQPEPTAAPILAAPTKPAQVSPADLLAYAKRFLPDEEIDAARLELEQMEAAARMQRNS